MIDLAKGPPSGKRSIQAEKNKTYLLGLKLFDIDNVGTLDANFVDRLLALILVVALALDELGVGQRLRARIHVHVDMAAAVSPDLRQLSSSSSHVTSCIVRASCAVYNTPEQYEQLADAVTELLQK